MKIKHKACGSYGTNCYIVSLNGKDIIIDPGMDAVSWVCKNVENPIAILNTHGHFDHVWSNKELTSKFNIPLYAPKNDIFMLENDPFSQGTPASHADFIVDGDEVLNIGGINVKFFLFPGHTPGCSCILIENALFSGDFIFKNSIGRFDFPYSNDLDMRKSLEKFLKIEANWDIYPGHGDKTTLKEEQKNVPYWFNYLG